MPQGSSEYEPKAEISQSEIRNDRRPKFRYDGIFGVSPEITPGRADRKRFEASPVVPSYGREHSVNPLRQIFALFASLAMACLRLANMIFGLETQKPALIPRPRR